MNIAISTAISVALPGHRGTPPPAGKRDLSAGSFGNRTHRHQNHRHQRGPDAAPKLGISSSLKVFALYRPSGSAYRYLSTRERKPDRRESRSDCQNSTVQQSFTHIGIENGAIAVGPGCGGRKPWVTDSAAPLVHQHTAVEYSRKPRW